MTYICTRGLRERLTHGKEYEGKKGRAGCDYFIICVDDRGKESTYPASRFIERAQVKACR